MFICDAGLIFAMIGVPVTLLLLIAYGISALISVYASLKKRTGRLWLVAVIAMPVIWVASYQIPIPGNVDGMRDALRDQVSHKDLLFFANQAGPMLVDVRSISPVAADPRVELMKRDYPQIYNLSKLSPRVGGEEGRVEIYWGSALVQHWGIFIGSPSMENPPARSEHWVKYLEVFEGVWVYQDKW